jgi:EGF-like domain
VACAGDAWEIERCDCKWSSSPGCELLGQDHLLWGYPIFRSGANGAHVPIGPAQCCRACLGNQIHALSECRALNHCNRRGICVLGACQCNAGWGGPACESRLRHETWPPPWVLYVAMFASVIFSAVAWMCARGLLQDFVERRRQAAEEQQALLVRPASSALRSCRRGPAGMYKVLPMLDSAQCG